MQVIVHRGPRTTHILNEQYQPICGAKIFAPFGVNATFAVFTEVRCKRCLKSWAKQHKGSVT